MNPDPSSACGGDPARAGDDARAALAARVARLEAEAREAQGALLALGPGRVPGLHLAVEVAGHRALLPAGTIREIAPLVAVRPLPAAPPQVLGTFALRGVPVTVLDLARCLGVAREPALDAQIVVLGTARAIGVLVDRVLAVEERVDVVEDRRPAGAPAADARFDRAGLVAGLCRWRDEVVPLADLARLLAAVEALP